MDGRTHDEILAPASRLARVNRWGEAPPHAAHLAERIVAGVTARTGRAPRPAPRRDRLPSVPATRIDGEVVEQLGRIARTTVADDVRRAMSIGKSYPDLVVARGSALDRACDVVVRPENEQELDRVLDVLAEAGVAVVPVGGGTSVVGGIEPLGTTADQPVAAIDLGALDRCIDVDERSRVATFEAGIRGPRLEQELAPRGLTVGHVPQSFELATLGGWVATRSAGQASLRFGKMEQIVAGLRMASPAGELVVGHLPAHGAGPDMRELVMGSEGAFGIITRATVRVSTRPTRVRFASWVFGSFEEATDAARQLAQSGIRPAMVRVSNGTETAFNVGTGVPALLRGALGRGLVRVLGLGTASLVFVISLGDEHEVRSTDRAVDQLFGRLGGRNVGPVPARKWYRSRFEQPYARDLLMDAGLIVDTLETSIPWSRVGVLHDEVVRAITSVFGAGNCMVGCHLSHLYRDGASAYFTFLAHAEHGRELDAWRAAKRAVHGAFVRQHAAASHQHGVGTMHADVYASLHPNLALDLVRSMRATCDPAGMMNPGKLVSAPAAGVVPWNAVHVPDGASAVAGITG